MPLYTLTTKPTSIALELRKKTTISAIFISEPFDVETQEGVLVISPETVDDWEDGYYIAYPSDGSKPYPISPKYIRDNYTEL